MSSFLNSYCEIEALDLYLVKLKIKKLIVWKIKLKKLQF